MSNPFDQFDTAQSSAPQNPFDQFDNAEPADRIAQADSYNAELNQRMGIAKPAPVAPVDRGALQTAKDLGLSVAAGAANLGGALTQATDMASRFIDPMGRMTGDMISDATGLPTSDDMYDAGRRISGDAESWLQNQKSAYSKARAQEVEGADGFWDTAAAYVRNPSQIAEGIAGSLPYMVPVGAAARMAKGAQMTAKGVTGVTAGTGAVLEGGAAGAQANSEIMDMTAGELLERSPDYAELIAQEVDPVKAKSIVASRAGLTAQALQMPVSFLASKLTGAAKLESEFFTGNQARGMLKIFPMIGKEAAEEVIQEGASQASVNTGVKLFGDENRNVMDNVGDAAASGLVVGAAQAGGMKGTGWAVNRMFGDSAPVDPNTDDGIDQPMNGEQVGGGIVDDMPQEAPAEVQQLGYNPERMVVMPDGTTAWESELPALAEQSAATQHPGYARITETPDQVEASLAEPVAIDDEINSMMMDLDNYRAERVRQTVQPVMETPAITGVNPFDQFDDAQPAGMFDGVRDMQAERANAAREQDARRRELMNANFQEDEEGGLFSGVRALAEQSRFEPVRNEIDGSSVSEYFNQANLGVDYDGQNQRAARTVQASDVQPLDWNEEAVRGEQSVSEREGMRALEQQLYGISGGYGGSSVSGGDARQNQVARGLRAGQRSLGDNENPAEQPNQQPIDRISKSNLNDQSVGGKNWDFSYTPEQEARSGNGPGGRFDGANRQESEAVSPSGGNEVNRTDRERDGVFGDEGFEEFGGRSGGGQIEAGDQEIPLQGRRADTIGNSETERADAGLSPRTDISTGEIPRASIDEYIAAETNASPTEAQKEQGNYKKAKIKLQGLDIAIENPRGSTRSGTDSKGNNWEVKMHSHYGYIKRTEGADGDHIDVFIGPNPESDKVFIVDQINPDGSFDEHKVLIGFDSKLRARSGYKSNYSNGWKVGPITSMSMDEFKEWVKNGETKKPLSPALTAQLSNEQKEAKPASKPPISESKQPKPESEAPIREQIAESPESDLPPILTQTKKQFISAMAKERGLKKDSPGYAAALLKLEDEYTESVDRAQAQLPFEKFNELNSDSPESINRQAYDALREDFGLKYSLKGNAPQTETAAFKRWFGDSKVVDADGKPLVVYHGTGRDFKKFRAKGERGFYFSSSTEAASSYAAERAPDSGGHIINAFLSMENPLVVDGNGGHWAEIPFQGKTASLDYIAQVARRSGYDGVIARRVQDLADMGVQDGVNIGDSYVVFQPEQIKSATGNNGEFDPANPDIRYKKQSPSGTQSISRDEAQAVIDRISKSWKVPVQVQLAYAVDDLPAGVRERMNKGGHTIDDIAALYDPKTASIFLNGNNIDSAAHAEQLVFHEVYAHMGLETLFGENLTSVMSRLYLAIGGRGGIDRLAAQHSINLEKYHEAYKDRPAAQRNAIIAEELLAHIAQNPKPKVQQIWSEVIGAIRAWLRKNGFAELSKITDSDISLLLKQARETVTKGKAGDTSGLIYVLAGLSKADRKSMNAEREPQMYSIKVPQTDTAAFKRWFGDSKVVDADGMPLVMYHGTKSDFSIFDPAFDKLGRGFFFGTADIASSFSGSSRGATGANVMPVYLRIKKPLIYDVNSSSKVSGLADLYEIMDQSEDAHDGIIMIRDGKVFTAITNNPNNIKSATGNNGEFNPANPDIRYALKVGGFTFGSSTTPRGATLPHQLKDAYNQLGGANKTLFEKVKTEVRRQLAPRGLLPSEIFDLKIARDGAMNADDSQQRFILTDFYNQVEAVYKKPYAELKAGTRKEINDYLKGDRTNVQLTASMIDVLAKMRTQIQSLSSSYMDQLLLDAANLEADGKLEAAAAKRALIETITDNFDNYLHRSYRAFDDPDWPKKVPEDVYQNAVNLLAREYSGSTTPDADAIEKATKKVDLILHEGTAYDSMGRFISESKLGSKDLSVIKKRKQISPEIRALLGEYEDPAINYAKSVTKMTRLVHNTSFLRQMTDISLQLGYIFEEENRPVGANKKIAADASEVYAPLNGMYTYPEFEQALRDAVGSSKEPDWYKVMVAANGAVKYGKTVLAPTTAVRNFLSASMFALTSGHWNASHLEKSVKVVKTYFTGKDVRGSREYINKLLTLGVLYDAPNYRELQDLIKSVNESEHWLANVARKTGVGKTLNYAQEFYALGDDFWKILGFENEKAMLIKHYNMSEAAAEKEAAERIRNTYPTYSLTGKGIQTLRRFPVIGSFPSFPAEIIRTTFHKFRYFYKDAQKLGYGNPSVVAKGVGLALGAGLMTGLSTLSAAMFGVDDDEEEAIRQMLPEWSKNSSLFFLGRDDKGQVQYMDLGWLDPYGYWKKPISALARDAEFSDKLEDATWEALSPFLGLDIAVGTTGQFIYDSFFNDSITTEKATEKLVKGLAPGAVNNALGFWEAANETVTKSGKKYTFEDEGLALLGFRKGTLNAKVGLTYQAYGYADRKRQAATVLREKATDLGKVDIDELRTAYEKSMGMQRDAWDDMRRTVKMALKTGMTKPEAIAALRTSGMSLRDASGIVSDREFVYQPSQNMMKLAIKRTGILFDNESKAELIERQKRLNELQREYMERPVR